jgi:hypothetical protein
MISSQINSDYDCLEANQMSTSSKTDLICCFRLLATFNRSDTTVLSHMLEIYLLIISVQKREYTCCRDNKPFVDVVTLPCDHEYCRDCIQQLFTRASADESLFPPHCCADHPLSPDPLQAFLTVAITEKHKEKEAEFSTPNRTYCSNARCAVWLRPKQIVANVGTCPVCK